MSIPQEQFPNDPSAGSQSDIGRLVSNLAYDIDRGIAQEMAPHGLLPMEVHLLMICREMGECSATQLVQLLPVDAARVSRLVNTLVEKGLMRRRRLRNDRRVVMLRLSEAGEALTPEITQRLGELYARLTDGLSEQEVAAFSGAVLKIIANYEASEGR